MNGIGHATSTKFDAQLQHARMHDFLGLVETRTASLNRLMTCLPTHTALCCNFGGAGGSETTPGSGLALLIKRTLRPYFRLWRAPFKGDGFQLLWAQLDGTLFGLGPPVLLGLLYVNPTTSARPAAAVASAIDQLSLQVAAAQAFTQHILLLGDFNAWLGSSTEAAGGHHLLARFPALALPRAGSHVSNIPGTHLLDLMRTTSLVATTGRGTGDLGQPSCRNATRPDHILLSSDLFALHHTVTVHPQRADYDHTLITLRLTAAPQPQDIPAHVCGASCPFRAQFTWRADQHGPYARQLASSAALRSFTSSFYGTVGRPSQHRTAPLSPDDANSAFVSIVTNAARACGMWRERCPLHPPLHRPHLPAWFDADCLRAKRTLQHAVHTCSPSSALLRKQYKSLLASRRRAWSRSAQSNFLTLLRDRPGEAFKRFKQQEPRVQSAVSIPQWQQHLTQHFQQQPQQPQLQAQQQPHPAGLDLGGPAGRPPAAAPSSQPAPAQAPPSFSHPSLPQIQMLVYSVLSDMNSATAPGLDGLVLPFLKQAFDPDEQLTPGLRPSNPLVDSLAPWFLSLFTLGQVPAAWKVARLSPLFKDGDPTDPNRYRMLAVSCLLYRIYANVVRRLLTPWCQAAGVVPDTQFGFYPKRSTMHPLFILRHLTTAQFAAKPAPEAPPQAFSPCVYAAFIDFTQAFDEIPRTVIWHHLEHSVRLPPPLLAAIRSLYDGDSYLLVDGWARAEPVEPDKGVKQGCPLSPLLFSLYINDIGNCWEAPFDGALTLHDPLRTVSHLLYADDLTLLANTQPGLQQLTDRLQPYAQRKHLRVNLVKSEVIAFHPKSLPPPPPSRHHLRRPHSACRECRALPGRAAEQPRVHGARSHQRFGRDAQGSAPGAAPGSCRGRQRLASYHAAPATHFRACTRDVWLPAVGHAVPAHRLSCARDWQPFADPLPFVHAAPHALPQVGPRTHASAGAGAAPAAVLLAALSLRLLQ